MEHLTDPVSRRRALTLAGGAVAATALTQTGPAFAASAAVTSADAIVVGHGLAGLVATVELAAAGRKVLLLDQEPESNLGGQAFWSFGGLFFVDSAEQRLMGVKDSKELAWQDWQGAAGFDRDIDNPLGQDHWALQVGPGVRRLRVRREAVLAGRPRYAVVPVRRLGGARRRPRGRPRQLRTALPRHLGHGSRRRGTVREEGTGGGGERARHVQAPPPRGRGDPDERHRHRRTRRGSRGEHRRAGQGQFADGGRQTSS